MSFTDYLAAYGAILSSLVAYWNYRKSKSHYRVEVIHATDRDDEGELRIGAGIFVQNYSSHDVHLEHVGILYPSRKYSVSERLRDYWRFKRIIRNYGWVNTSFELYGADNRCPVTLKPGASHYVFLEERILEQIFSDAVRREFKAHAQDALWRDAYSKAFKY